MARILFLIFFSVVEIVLGKQKCGNRYDFVLWSTEIEQNRNDPNTIYSLFVLQICVNFLGVLCTW